MEEQLMRMLKVLCCAAAMAAFTAPLAQAQGGTAQWKMKTHLTFSGPVQIPGKTLPAGTYTFRAMDLLANRNVLQILDQNEQELIATVMTQSDTKLEPAENNVVMFSERPAGQPTAIKTWYYPGQKIGNEFVYPRAQAIEIAKANNTTVLSSADEGASEAEMRSAEVGRVNAEGQIVDDDAAVADNTASRSSTPAATAAARPDAQNQNRNQTQAQAQPSTPARAEQAPAPASPAVGTSGQAQPATRSELPRTAGNLVLAELLSALSIAGFFGARRLRRRHDSA
jgi:hypothetical protein